MAQSIKRGRGSSINAANRGVPSGRVAYSTRIQMGPQVGAEAPALHAKEEVEMSRGLTALLGLLAVAGYQNRDKIAEMLRGVGQSASGASGPGGQGGLGGSPTSAGSAGTSGLGGLLEGFSGANPGGFLSKGLHDLINSFNKTGQGEVAQSWVGRGPNKEIAPPHLEQAIGPDVLASLSERTGLSREELLQRLSRELPNAVDRYTPDGRLPTEADLSRS